MENTAERKRFLHRIVALNSKTSLILSVISSILAFCFYGPIMSRNVRLRALRAARLEQSVAEDVQLPSPIAVTLASIAHLISICLAIAAVIAAIAWLTRCPRRSRDFLLAIFALVFSFFILVTVSVLL